MFASGVRTAMVASVPGTLTTAKPKDSGSRENAANSGSCESAR